MLGIVIAAGFAGEKFQSVELLKSFEDKPLYHQKNMVGIENRTTGCSEWRVESSERVSKIDR
jgi:hypothetical protein